MANELRSDDRFVDGFWVGNWFVEPMLNRVRHEDDEEAVQLEPKVMEVLLCMAERPGKAVTKEQFKEEVWTDTVVTDDVLSRCISELRKIFDDDSRDPTYIETIRKTGYRLIAPVRTPGAGTPTSTDKNGATGPEQEQTSTRDRRLAQRISGNLQGTWSNARDSWVLVAGGIIDRKWIIGAGVTVGVILLVSLVSWSDVDIGTGTEPPPPSTPLTSFPGEEFAPSLSNSGKQVVFAWRNADSLYQNIYLIQQGADRPLRLSADTTTDWSPTWSPDGRFVAYVRDVNGEHQVAIVPSIGGRVRLVTRRSARRIHSLSWSPDTTQSTLAMSAQRRPHQAFALSLLFPDADSVQALTDPPLWSTGDTSPVFSPDGSRIAFVRGTVNGVEDLFVVPVEGGDPTRVTNDSSTIRGLAWSPDGESLIYASQRGGVSGLWRVDADGGAPSLVRTASEGTVFSHPTVSGTSLAYTQESAQSDIWRLRRSSRYAAFQSEPVTSSTQEDKYPTISPSGDRLAFVSERSGQPEVWVSAMNGSAASQVSSLEGPDIRSVAWSSDGTQICFVARKNGASNLFSISASGGPVEQLTEKEAEVVAPRWGRSDRWIYYASNETGAWEIWRTSRKNGESQQVTTGGAIAAQESVDGNILYAIRADTTGLWAAPLDTANFPLRTHSLRPDDRLTANRDSLSRTDTASSSASSVNETGERAPAFHQVVDEIDPRDRMNWWIEDDGVYYLRHRRFRSAVLTFFDFRSRQTIPLYTFPNWHPDQHIAVGPGGESVAYTNLVRRESDIMLMEDVQP